MALYYLPALIRSDRYFVTRLEHPELHTGPEYAMEKFAGINTAHLPDYNFVIHAEDRVLAPLFTIEDPSKTVLTQLAPTGEQDIPLSECRITMEKRGDDFELIISPSGNFSAETFKDAATGLTLDYTTSTGKIVFGYYSSHVSPVSINLFVTLRLQNGENFTGRFQFSIARARNCHRVVIDFGSEASQVGYRNCGPQSTIMQYDILENIISQLNLDHQTPSWRREDFLNQESGQPMLYRSFYAVRKNLDTAQRQKFPFNFTDDLSHDEIRLFITREEVAATQFAFRENYEIIPNLKLGMEKSLQLRVGKNTEDYSVSYHKKELISAILLRVLRLMIRTKPGFRQGGLIVTLLVPNIYTQHDVFELLNELRQQTAGLLSSLDIDSSVLAIEFETISESDAAFMGYQQTHSSDIRMSNGDMALVIDCGKGTTDISMVLADDNENYSSFFRTGFAGAGNVLLYGFAEDFLTLVLRTIPGNNNLSIREFLDKHVRDQDLTADVLEFISLMEDQKKRYGQLAAIGITEFAQLKENSDSTERTIGNLYKDPFTLLQYAVSILKERNIRWDEEVTGLISRATDCIAQCIVDSIRDVMTKDIRKRIKVVMLSGRAFYFTDLRVKLEQMLQKMLGADTKVTTVPAGRSINNKNVAIYGAFSGAYKITDFTGIPIDRKEGLSRNNDVINNNMYLYRGIKIQPGNDILYNAAVVRRNHLELKDFRNKTVDIFFTRDNIFLRLMENQKVKAVHSLTSILSAIAETYSPFQDMKVISMFPGYRDSIASIDQVHADVSKEREKRTTVPVRKKAGILQFFNF